MGHLIVYGNCQSLAIFKILHRLPAVAERWTLVRHDVTATGDVLAGDLAQFDSCDILLQQDVSDWHRHPRVHWLAPQTRAIRFPFCRFAALWPFDGHQNGRGLGFSQGEGERKFAYQDHLLGRLRTEISDSEERFHRYIALDIPDIPDIARYAELEAARLLREDTSLGFGLGRWILDNYREVRLFHTITHPARPLVRQMAMEVLARLGIEAGPIDDYVLDFFANVQVPLHPKVIAALGLRWAGADDTYSFPTQERLTFEAYVRR
jgi:hypothetical protein